MLERMRQHLEAWPGFVGAIACGLSACSHAWDAYDPAADDASGASTGLGGAATGSASTASNPSGGAGGVGGGSGASAAGGTGGAGGSAVPGSVLCAAHFAAVGSTYMRRVMVDGDGGIVVLGPIQGGADLGGGVLPSPPSVDAAAIVKLDADCDHVWSKAFPGAGGKTSFWTGALWPNGDVAAVGNIAGTADFGGGARVPVGLEDLLVARFDPAGNHVWSKSYGLANAMQWPHSAAIDPAGNVVVFGNYHTGASFGGTTFTGNGLFLAKLSGESGAHVWSKSFASPSSRGRSIVIDAAGDIFLTGRFTNTIAFGAVTLTAAGTGRDGFVVKLDDAGDTVWARRFGSPTGSVDDYGHAVALDGAGGVLLSGRFGDSLAFDSGSVTSAGDRDIFLTALDGAGTSSWTKRFGGPGFDSALGMAVDGSSQIALAGRFEGTTDLGGVALTAVEDADAFVARYDDSGNHLWSRRFGGAGFQSASSVVSDASGKVIVTGYFGGSLEIEGRTIVPMGTGQDGFVLVLAP
jgi:hypothetical protein